jgi:Tfp pilus assembly protein PilX
MLNHRQPMRALRAPRRQRGDIMLVTMVFLLLCLLGLIGSMRDTIVSTTLTSNNLMRQKDTQVADIAMQSVRNQILTTAAAGLPLATTNVINQPWWRDVGATTAATPPSASYWKTCLGNSDPTQRCGAVALTIGGTTLPYTALAVVQPTGRSDPNGLQCPLNNIVQATFYAIFIHVQEANGATSVNTESVYQVCEQLS